ncbi:MAG: hypothetical protein UT48_C0003G0020 [Parcubacteria group bacterium GW2011_GWE2_39_37]|nr:MAG: hypothetical protein UT48_C0003G0020 [Parcubacteria group bacterium GW2011_GWE2_39_37]
MPQKNNKNIYINKDDYKASRFVLDLNAHLKAEADKKEIKPTKKEKIKSYIESVAMGEKKLVYKPDFSETQARLTHSGKKLFSTSKSKVFKLINRIKKLILGIIKIIFWPVILVGKLFYSICYSIGWTVIFLSRFITLLVIALKNLIGGNLKRGYVLFNENIKFKLKFKLPKRISRQEKKLVKKISKMIATELDSETSESSSVVSPDVINSSFFLNFKKVLSFAIVLIVLILPFKAYTFYQSLDDLKNKLTGETSQAINDMVSAGKSAADLDFEKASQNFSAAGSNFFKAQSQITEIHDILLNIASVVPNQNIRLASNAKYILAAGQETALLGQNLSLAVNSILMNDGQPKDIVKMLDNFTAHSNEAINNARSLNQELKNIEINDLPEEYRQQFIEAKEKAVFLEKSLTEFVDLIEKIKILIGVDQDKRYLLIFQNNAEARATGGFFGSYALVDFHKGKIKNIETPGGGSYDTEAGLRERIVAPSPLHLLNPLWHFWDANWWPDWPTAAKKLMWFYEKSDGPTVDGVISLTPTVIEEYLKIIGPIDMKEKYGEIIDEKNFWDVAQKFSEQKPDQTKEPKKIIGDLMNQMISGLPNKFNRESLFGLINATEKNLREKQVLFFFKNQELQEAIENYGWDGKIKNTEWDYLSIVNSNIGGGKSDKKIIQKVHHQAEVMPDGSIINKLEISRAHTGEKNEMFSGVRNVDWMRIYVPAGSELIETRGFSAPNKTLFTLPDPSWKIDPDLANEESFAEINIDSGTKIYKEAGKTVFANWSMVDPGETTNIYLKYKLPFQLTKKEPTDFWQRVVAIINPNKKQLYPYALLAQKQAGALSNEFFSRLIINEKAKFSPVWNYPKNLGKTNFSIDNTGWKINDELNVDKYWAVFLEEK